MRATILAAAGLALTFAAPQHRVDLLIIGVVCAFAGIVWRPSAGPPLIGATLPFFFFARQLAGPLSFSPPGLALTLTWVAVLVRHNQVRPRWPITRYDAPLVLFLVAALVSLSVTQYPLLSIRELRAVIFEPIVFFWLLHVLPGSARPTLYGFLACAT